MQQVTCTGDLSSCDSPVSQQFFVGHNLDGVNPLMF